MTTTWGNLARSHGRKSVMSLTIDDATLDLDTDKQIDALMPMIRPLLDGDEANVLDFGCGAGRFTGMLQTLTGGCVIGFDPCAELVDAAPAMEMVSYTTGDTDAFFMTHECRFDVVFVAFVLGDPGVDCEAVAAGVVRCLKPGGLLILLDHMPYVEPQGRWWRFRSSAAYTLLFRDVGVDLHWLGNGVQLDNATTLLAGRKS